MDAKSKSAVSSGILSEIEPWLAHLRARNRSVQTIASRRGALLRLATYLRTSFCVLRLKDASRPQLEAWFHGRFALAQSMVYIDVDLSAAKQFYGWLESRGLLFENPAKGLIMPRYHRKMQPVPSESQMRQLVQGIDGDSSYDFRDRAIVEVAYATGFRLHELAGLTLGSVDLSRGTARIVGKGGRERIVPLTQAAIHAVTNYLQRARPHLLRGKENQPALWLGKAGGRRLLSCGIAKMVIGRASAVKLQISPLSIRRAFATHMLNHGASPMELKLLLGHAGFRHLRHYLRYAPTELREIHRRSRPGR